MVETTHKEDEKARLLSQGISTLMSEIRTASDDLESLIADDYWPLPKYRELLFLSVN